MKIGDLIRGKDEVWFGDIPYGIIIDESVDFSSQNDGVCRWWTILLLGGSIMEDAESVWEIVV